MENVVICRLRYSLATMSAGQPASAAEPDEAAPPMP